jgi:hypothetical protein
VLRSARTIRYVCRAGDAHGGRVIGDRDVLVAELLCCLRHLLQRIPSIAVGRVHLEIAADLSQLQQLRQCAGACGVDLAARLAQLR